METPKMSRARTFYAIRAVILIVVTISLAVSFTFDMGVAKNNNISVKMSPEYTRQKKGGDKIETSTQKTGVNNITKKAISNTKQKQPQITKTPSPGGPVATPYPN